MDDPAYDDLGRTVSVTTPDSAVVSTAYSLATSGSQIGTTVTVTDQAGKLRRSITNVLGQLIRVDEPNSSNQLGSISSPNQPTYYYYNTQGKMVRVNQGVQDRYFMYDSLGRLLRIRQPEQEVNTALNTSGNPGNNSWTAGFTYDANGNILTTTDANNVTLTSTYDALNRQVTRSYTASTPTVTYTYDDPQIEFSKGRLTKVSSSVSESRYTGFDAAGRLLEYKQITDGETYTLSYEYNLSGALVQETYPSGRVVQNALDANGDLSMVKSRKNAGQGFWNYAGNFSYNASGAVTSMRLGNGLWETSQFNSRMQVSQMALGVTSTDTSLWKVDYEFGELQTDGTVDASKNNGDIGKQTLTVPGTNFVQTYKYDPLNRLTEAKEVTASTQNWIQQFGYDRYGNRTSFNQTIGSTNANTTPAIDADTNRFDDNDFTYDANGNVVGDIDPITSLGRSFTFNGDNKQTEVKRDGVTIGRYYYDGEGRRIKKVTDTEMTVFVYSAGKLIAEYSTELSQTPSVSYLTNDHLGSPRIITNENGQVNSRRDFMPFGEDIYQNVGGRTSGLKYGASEDDVRQKFTGYQKDNETQLDFAEARMYENRFGRFTAVDPLLASRKSANPQTFNRYVYVLGMPLVLIDPTGEAPSTHIDENGKVVAVIDDGDLGVYQHKNNADGKAPTAYMIEKRQGKTSSYAGGGTKIGETAIWHEFREHDKAGNPTSQIAPGAQIVKGLDFLPVVNEINQAAKELTLGAVMDLSKNGQPFDIKTNTTLAPSGSNTGGLLGDYFVTARSAGNFLFGMNGANVSTNSYVNDYLSFDALMRVAGEYEQTGKMDATTAVGLRTGAISPTVNVAPFYGESSYSGLYIMAGYEYGKSRR